MNIKFFNLLPIIFAAGTIGCQAKPQSATSPNSNSQTIMLVNEEKTSVVTPDTRDMLADLAKGHQDKIQLAWYATSIFRTLQPPVKEFAIHMGKEHKDLYERLKKWADKHAVSIKFSFGDDLYGKARKDMEKKQGDELQATKGGDFQHYFLMLMAVDYLSQEGFIKALLTVSPDPELAGYLQDSLKAHEQDRAQINQFLKQYKYEENAKR